MKPDPTSPDLTRIGVQGLSRLIETRAVSPREITEAHLARIERLDKLLGAFQAVTADRARAEAATAEREIMAGTYRGPLHGIPFAVKDIIEVAGLVTTAGSRVHAARPAGRDAPCVAALRQAGAIMLGKTATYEYATGGPSFDLPWPPTRNPWNLDHNPGGSSTGSAAAVAAGLAPFALGTDTGGSVRVPASYSGLTGIKPGFDAIPGDGVCPLAPSLDTVGVLARSAADGAIALAALTGQPSPLPADSSLRGVRIGIAPTLTDGASAEVATAFDAAIAVFRGLGATIETVTLAAAEDYGAVQRMIVLAEGFAVHRATLATRLDDYGEVFRYRVLPGVLVGGGDLAAAYWLQRKLTAQMLATLGQVDLLLAPTTLGPAPAFSNMSLSGRLQSFPTAPFSVTRVPTVALCMGFSAQRLPLSLQIAGKPADEATILRVAHAYQQATGWHLQSPPEPATPARSTTPPWTASATPVDAATAAYVAACLDRHGIRPSERQFQQLTEGAGAVLAMARSVHRHVAPVAG